MSLKKYQEKRDFNKTPEPKGHQLKGEMKSLFVVQKHAARHLHYDFRIELNGVLKSWAVPKGPCLDPGVKRLAMHVEDHPLDYGNFEGIIPKGEYGGGTVMLWDKGRWEPLDDDPVKAYQKGHLRFLLHAEKLKGRWDLIRFKKEDNAWFLIKYKDEFAQSSTEEDIVLAKPDSVLTGYSLEDIEKHYDSVWTKKGEKKVSEKKMPFNKARLNLPAAVFPGFIEPQLATKVDKVPKGEDWLHEIKFDGYRMLAYKNKKKVKLLSRNNKDWTAYFPVIVKRLAELPIDKLILDGEVVLLDKENRSDFQLLQNAIKDNPHAPFIYYAFDLLFYDKWNTQALPLVQRKDLLRPLFTTPSSTLRYSDHVIGQGDEIYQQSCKFKLEGIISKKINSSYLTKRSKTWLKVKCVKRQEFVIGGFAPAKGARPFFGSLYLGVYDKKGQFIFCGNVGTGFTQASLESIYQSLEELISSRKPFHSDPPGSKTATWVKPQLIAEVEFTEWTSEGRLRHPSFKGLRLDKSPKDVHKEKEVPVNKITERKESIDIKLTHPNKIYYPEDAITKRQLAEYYSEITPYILPFIINRPLTLVRCPDGYQECFYQKHVNKSSSKFLKAIPVKSLSTEKVEKNIYLNDQSGLMGLVQMGVLEIHPWGSSIEDIEKPNMIIFDLDPDPDVQWKKVVAAALNIKDHLKDLKLTSFVKSTGGKGLHVVIPINPEHDWEVIKTFSKFFVEFIERQDPSQYTTNMSKVKRKGKIYLDYLRNQRGATAIAAYSTRAKPHATVAVPLHWDELTLKREDTLYTIHTLLKRIRTDATCPWSNFWDLEQSLVI